MTFFVGAPHPDDEDRPVLSPKDLRDSSYPRLREDTTSWRKKRKTGSEDKEHQSETRRVSRTWTGSSPCSSCSHISQPTHRKYPSRTKPPRAQSSASEALEPQTAGFRGATDEEMRLASSDLEDCEEVWFGELGDYMLETQKRQNQVADWFEASIVVSASI